MEEEDPRWEWGTRKRELEFVLRLDRRGQMIGGTRRSLSERWEGSQQRPLLVFVSPHRMVGAGGAQFVEDK